MRLLSYGVRKFPPTSELLVSSAGLGWSAMSAQLWYHGPSEAAMAVAQQAELCLVIDGNEDGLVRRTEAELHQEAMPRTGAIWLSPAGVSKEIAITAPIPRTLHLFLPATLFEGLESDFNLPITPGHAISHAAGIEDEVINQLGRSILSELINETAAGRLFVETASLTLAARLLQKHCDSEARTVTEAFSHHIDHARIRRTLGYIAANMGNDITLAELAGIAGYSLFHFTRMFTSAMGVSPYRYLNRMRIERAMAELTAGRQPLADIAFNAHFSSQASFTRAFHRATGMTPKEFQRQRR